MDSQKIQILIAFICYLTMMVIVGLRYVKKTKSSSDFFLGGRKTGPWITALSTEASDMSAWLLMGLPGIAYVSGLSGVFWTALGLLIGTYLNWLFVAKRLRSYSVLSGDSITIPEFFVNRFKDKNRIIGLLSTVIILVFFTVYAASGFVACAKVFNLVYGIEYTWALLLAVAVILGYTLLGGYLAVCATDFIQGTIMFFALVISVIIMIIVGGGFTETFAKLSSFGNEFVSPVAVASDTGSLSPLKIIGDFAWGLGYFGMPHILIRFMSLRSNKEIALSRRIAMVWVSIALVAAIMVGLVAKNYLAPGALASSEAENVFLAVIMKMFPAFIAGIFLCSIMAAAMSSADSQLLVAASAFSHDVYKGFINKNASEKTTLNLSRLTVCMVAVIAFIIALDPDSSVFGLVSFAWAGFGAAFSPIILLALFWKGTTKWGAISGMVSGMLVAILWFFLDGGIFDVYEILPGFLAALLVAIIVSFLDKNKDPEMLAEFDNFKKIND